MYAIIAAAGSGSRMREAATQTSKVLIPLHDGLSALALSIKNFAACPSCRGIVIAAREEDTEEIQALFSQHAASLDCQLAPGGQDRQQSVYHALCLLESKAEFVAVHDAARPFCSPEKIEAVYQAARQTGAALLAIPATSTLKEVQQQRVSRTLDRSVIWEAQTPQVFRYELLRQAHEKSLKEGGRATDDSELVELLGESVQIVQGEPENIKLTTPSDLRYARFLLQAQDD